MMQQTITHIYLTDHLLRPNTPSNAGHKVILLAGKWKPKKLAHFFEGCNRFLAKLTTHTHDDTKMSFGHLHSHRKGGQRRRCLSWSG